MLRSVHRSSSDTNFLNVNVGPIAESMFKARCSLSYHHGDGFRVKGGALFWARVMASCAQSNVAGLVGYLGLTSMVTAAPIGQSMVSTDSIAVLPSSLGRNVTWRLCVLTMILPMIGPITEPTITRSPLPTQPREGLRHCLQLVIGLASENL